MLKNKNTSKSFGNYAEDYVANYLIKNGFAILERNYQKRFGEIDIIAQKEDVLAFVEVKARNSLYFGLSEVITRSKQKKIILTAKDFLMKNRFDNKVFRFDVALLQKKEDEFEIEYIQNAFNETQ